MNEEQVIELSNEIDGLILVLSEKYDSNFLAISAIILARLARFSLDLNEKESFLKLMNASAGIINDKPQEQNLH